MSGERPKEPVNTEDLFREHAPFVARFLSRLGVWPDELDDAVQEVFLVVHRRGGYVPGPATPTGYLASIAVRAASSHRRRTRKSRDRKSEVAPDEVSSAKNDPARSLEVQESLVEMQTALDQLEPDQRATLLLAELEGESCGSIRRHDEGARRDGLLAALHRAPKTFRREIETRRAAQGAAASSAMVFARSADNLLGAARAHPGMRFDVASALARFREALGSGAAIPPWAVAATGLGAGSGISLTAPALLATLVVAHSAFTGAAGGGRGVGKRSRPRASPPRRLSRPWAPSFLAHSAPCRRSASTPTTRLPPRR